MYIILVHSHVYPEHVERFREITLQNAEASRGEAGCVRFDVLQQMDDPTRFTFIEMFKSEADALTHRETPHFKKWLEEAVPLMVEERRRIIYRDVSLTEK
ncbi:MAG: putative quinol monooxygenase [Chloroflexota bacterium]|nr:antibiotic biosynthesis monooxygenase [Chloroflexota bacterium]MBI5704166.1 antibiotic biosynthesis monooxygenase [Chloroflexota bacterium]